MEMVENPRCIIIDALRLHAAPRGQHAARAPFHSVDDALALGVGKVSGAMELPFAPAIINEKCHQTPSQGRRHARLAIPGAPP